MYIYNKVIKCETNNKIRLRLTWPKNCFSDRPIIINLKNKKQLDFISILFISTNLIFAIFQGFIRSSDHDVVQVQVEVAPRFNCLPGRQYVGFHVFVGDRHLRRYRARLLLTLCNIF